MADDERPDPSRVRSALALLPEDSPTRMLQHCLEMRFDVSLGEAEEILLNAASRAAAITTLVTADQEWRADEQWRAGRTSREQDGTAASVAQGDSELDAAIDELIALQDTMAAPAPLSADVQARLERIAKVLAHGYPVRMAEPSAHKLAELEKAIAETAASIDRLGEALESIEARIVTLEARGAATPAPIANSAHDQGNAQK